MKGDPEPMRDLHERLFDFLVFHQGNDVAKLTHFAPTDRIVLDSIEDDGKKATTKLFYLDAKDSLQDLGTKATFSLDKEGFPTSVKLEICQK